MRVPPTTDLQGLPREALALIEQMQRQIEQQGLVSAEHERSLAERVRQLAERQALLQRKDREVALRDARLEKLEVEIARFKRWKFGARTEAMNARQRRLFEETLAEDQAALQAALEQPRAEGKTADPKPKAPARRPRREALPAHPRRVEHRHEPEDTTCPNEGCGQPMTRIGQDVSERLDVVPAEIIEGGIPASALLAHTLISRFADHLPCYRQEAINARSGVHTPSSTLAPGPRAMARHAADRPLQRLRHGARPARAS